MQILSGLRQLFCRFRYPVSLPENVAEALGIEASNALTFDQFVHQLSNPAFRPTKLKKYMSRQKAETAFQGAVKKEKFPHKTLFSYYFNEGWLEFVLLFDDQSRLRRIYLQHKKIPAEEGLELTLNNDSSSILPS